jgi:hypothetical protein
MIRLHDLKINSFTPDGRYIENLVIVIKNLYKKRLIYATLLLDVAKQTGLL